MPACDGAGPAPQFDVALIVEARGVDKRYDTGRCRCTPSGGQFSVRRGEMVASIMGPSGSGKTTLLNCLSGLDAIDGGDVLIEGVALGAMSDDERTDYRARRMGFVFQFYNLMPVLTRGRERRAAAAGGTRPGEGGAPHGRSTRSRWSGSRDRADARAGRALGRPAPAGDDRPRARQRPGDRLGRRADRRPRQRERRGDRGADAAAEPRAAA